ncbi:MAG: Zn-dependent hydrolase [Rhodospirillaceae bacterium]
MSSTAPIDADRLWQSHMEMAEIGATPAGGVGRLALTDLDKQSRDLFVRWCRDGGYAIRVDTMGNIFARRPGTESDRPPVMTGSHLDTQPLGGKFDGAYGVLAGLEVLRALDDAGVKTRAPTDVVVWSDEEGVRFAGGVVGSGVFAGRFDLDYGLNMLDRDGTTTFGRELARIAYDGNEPCGGYPIAAFFEAHIEQGPILENEGAVIGAVLGAQGQKCFSVTVTGDEGHAGTLPMALRKDAMVGTARMMDALNRMAFEYDPTPVLTTGYVRVWPNSRNTIQGLVNFSVDCRHPDDEILEAVCGRIDGVCRQIADGMGLGLIVDETSARRATHFDGACVQAVRDASDALGLTWRDIHSGAGHDACNLARCTPTGMIFVPCAGGISHNERETATREDLADGCRVLLEVIVEHSGRA